MKRALLLAASAAVAASTLTVDARAGLGNPTAFVSSDNVNMTVYRDANDGSIHLFTQTSTQADADQADLWNLTAIANPGYIAGPWPLSTYVRSDNVNSIFVDGMYELSLPKGGGNAWSMSRKNWAGTPAATPMVGANLGLSLASTAVYVGSQHVYEVPETASPWPAMDLNANMLPGAGTPVNVWQQCVFFTCVTSRPFAYTRSDNVPSIVYVGTDLHIHEFFYSLFQPTGDNRWQTEDLTGLAGAPVADSHTVYGVMIDSNTSQSSTSRVFFLSNGHVMDLYHSTSTSGWQVEDVTQDAISQGTTPATLGSFPVPWMQSDVTTSLAYLGSDGHIHQLSRAPGSSSHWKDQDFSTSIGAPGGDSIPAPLWRRAGAVTDTIVYHATTGDYIQLQKKWNGWTVFNLSAHTTVH